DALVVYREALAADYLIEQRTAPAPPLLGQGPQPLPQFTVAIFRRCLPESASCDPDQPASATLRQLVPRHYFRHHLPLHRGPYPFFASTSFNARRSSAWSATIDFSRWFSSSSCRSRRISETSNPPYLLRHV